MTRLGSVAACVLLGACGPSVVVLDAESDDGLETEFGSGEDGSASSDDGWDTSTCAHAGGPGLRCVDLAGWDPPSPEPLLDVLIVIDNSVSMIEEQANVAHNLFGIVRGLQELTDAAGAPLGADVHVMVTTGDLGSPLCAELQGYEPAGGAPVVAGCNARIAEFSDPTGMRNVEEACTAVCPVDVVSGTSFVAFGPGGSNVPDVAPIDIDGDGTLEDAAAQAVACIGAQGIIGCEYESPLEAMLQALDPGAAWNAGSDPFLREDAVLFVVLVTDEMDCSTPDPGFVLDPSFMNADPVTLEPAPSSASCWNAGATCVGPDQDGVYSDCASVPGPLHDVARYESYLQAAFEDRFVLAIVAGVPPVTEYNMNPPYEPIAGGVYDLVYRDWRDPAYPEGDILPADWDAGVTSVDQQFRFGIGPGCTSDVGQAPPPVRMRELCDALEGETTPRCWIESICDDDFSGITHLLSAPAGPLGPPPG